MKPFLSVAGRAREARLAGAGVECVLSGADALLLQGRLIEIDPAAYAGIVSFGLAGGLDPAMRPGDLLIGTRAVDRGATYDAHPKLSQWIGDRLAARGLVARTGVTAGVWAPVLTVADKRALQQRTRALAVDMESHLAGDFAARARLPFAIVRVIADPAERALPPLASHAIGAHGQVRLWHVLSRLARAPGQIGALTQAGRDSRAAFATLKRCGGLFVDG